MRLPFGPKSAPSMFQRILNIIFAEYLYKFLLVHVDDCIRWSKDNKSSLEHNCLIFETASKYGVKFKPSKCSFFTTELDILGHKITQEGKSPTVKGVEAIGDMPRPLNTSGMKRFRDLCSYFHYHIKILSEHTCYFRQLLQKDVKFYWSDEWKHEFNDLKHALLSDQVVLYHPDWTVLFQVHVDASKIGVGAMLAQEKDGYFRPVRLHLVPSPYLRVIGTQRIKSSMQ